MESMKGARHIKEQACAVPATLVALYDALLNTFLSQLLVSKPHTKSSSALDYMNIVQHLT